MRARYAVSLQPVENMCKADFNNEQAGFGASAAMPIAFSQQELNIAITAEFWRV